MREIAPTIPLEEVPAEERVWRGLGAILHVYSVKRFIYFQAIKKNSYDSWIKLKTSYVCSFTSLLSIINKL